MYVKTQPGTFNKKNKHVIQKLTGTAVSYPSENEALLAGSDICFRLEGTVSPPGCAGGRPAQAADSAPVQRSPSKAPNT